jgi:hypothetical protein
LAFAYKNLQNEGSHILARSGQIKQTFRSRAESLYRLAGAHATGLPANFQRLENTGRDQFQSLEDTVQVSLPSSIHGAGCEIMEAGAAALFPISSWRFLPASGRGR